MFFDRVLKVENVGSGKTAIITPGLGATYDKFILNLGGNLVAADISEIRIKANDVEIFKDTGTNLDLRQTYNGIDTDAGEITIDFTEPDAKASVEQYLASIPANLLKKLTIEVDIADNIGEGETYSMTVDAEFRGPTKNAFILKRRKFNYYAAGAADHDLFLPTGIAGGIIKRVWLHEGDAVTKAMLRVGGFIAQNYKTVAVLERQQVRNKKVPQAGMVVLDFVQDGNLNGALNTSAGQEVALQLTTSGAQAISGYIDYIDPIDRLK